MCLITAGEMYRAAVLRQHAAPAQQTCPHQYHQLSQVERERERDRETERERQRDRKKEKESILLRRPVPTNIIEYLI